MNNLIREAVGIFFDSSDIKSALKGLQEAGFEHDEIGLLAGEHAVEQALGDLYKRTNTYQDCTNSPETAFVKRDSLGDTFRSLAGGLIFTGATTAMGIAVVSAGIFGGALMVAATGAAAVVGLGALIGSLIHQSDAEYLEEQVDEGHLLLFVRVNNSEEEKRALSILADHAGYNPRIYEVKAEEI